MKRLILMLVVMVMSSQVHGQNSERIDRRLPENVKVTRNIVYATYGDRHLMLDLYEPKQRADSLLPAIIAIRGGAWLKGSKGAFGRTAAALAERGFVAVSIEYRTSTEARFPAAVEDTKAAVRWLRANAEQYGCDPDAIGAIGGSAGAHLAVYLGVTSGEASLEGSGGNQDMASSISAVVGLATPSNFVSFKGEAATSNAKPEIAFLGAPYNQDPKLWTFASPISHVTSSSLPLLLIHSESDRLVPYAQSVEMAEKYASVGAVHEIVSIPDAPHDFWNFKQWFDETMDRSAAFFWKHFGHNE